MKTKRDFENFLNLSVMLTGFSKVDLLSTGLAEQYFDTICSIIEGKICNRLWSKSSDIMKEVRKDQAVQDEIIREQLMSHSEFGPVVRNIIKLWYLGQWEASPVFGDAKGNVDRIISSSSYKEGLVWVAIGAHPMGAKQPGYGTWSSPPKPPPKNL